MTPKEWIKDRELASINYKLAILVTLAIIAILTNGTRTYTNLKGDQRQKRIEYLDAKIIKLEAQIEQCQSGTPMPFISGIRIGTETN